MLVVIVLLNVLKKEWKYLAVLFVIVLVILKIAYYREGILEVVKITVWLFWLFVIPGYVVMLNWQKTLGFVERSVIGTIAGIAVIGLSSYYFGIAGLRIGNQQFILPVFVVVVAFSFQGLRSSLKSWAKKSLKQQSTKELQK
jgi:hypothetical protein